jgi:tRNA/tmRNA/rRNA uracil-C5-methylase (TrmA/RlmC/RlmD family)
VFVRHTLPGERVLAEVTQHGPKGRFLRAEAVSVLEGSPHRVDPPCAHALECGGCDWQHVSLTAQRELKATVVAEQLRRLAGLDVAVVVEPVPGDLEGLGWRTRVRYAVGTDGRPGFRRHRSHDVVPVAHCPIAHRLVEGTGVSGQLWPPGIDVEVSCAPSTGETSVRSSAARDGDGHASVLHEHALDRDWQVSGGFWQVHPGAPRALVGSVLDQLQPRLGEHVLDLYCGVGLFAGPLAERLGPGGRVDAVEADPVACADASTNLSDLPWVRVHRAAVVHYLRTSGLRRVDLVVLDPPRTGAGKEVTERIAALEPRAVSYVACDPAALARDLGTFGAHGYRLAGLRALDLFPMTHHVECVALLVRGEAD